MIKNWREPTVWLCLQCSNNKAIYRKITKLVMFSSSTLLLWNLSFWPNSNWLWQDLWNKNYWWHHSMLSTRPPNSTILVTSVKVSWLRSRTPEVSFENYTWFWLTQLNYKWLRPRTPERALWKLYLIWLTQLNLT